MSRWFRLYDGLLDDPKVQRLPDGIFRAVINLWCLTSQCGGNLPPVDDIAFKLRITPTQAAKILEELTDRGLIDVDEKGMRPHNWKGRQFQADVSTGRVKRFRERRETVSGNGVKPFQETAPDTESESDTESEKKDAASRRASAHSKPFHETLPSLEVELYARGKQILGQDAGGLITKLLKFKNGNHALALAVLHTASTKQNPREYICAILRGQVHGEPFYDPAI